MITYPQQFTPWEKGSYTFDLEGELKDWYHVRKESGTWYIINPDLIRQISSDELERKWVRDRVYSCLVADLIIFHAMNGSKFGLR